jgi:hypothetical protein
MRSVAEVIRSNPGHVEAAGLIEGLAELDA